MTEEQQPSQHDLRAVTPRLADLQRKCRSVGTRNDEALEMEKRIESILKRLDVQDDSDPEPIPFAALARELYAVERFFESNGFLSIAKEVAHVERALESFSTPDELETLVSSTVAGDEEENSEPEPPIEEDQSESPTDPSPWAVPKPLATVVFLFVAAVAVCIWIIVRHQDALIGTPDQSDLQTNQKPPPPVATSTAVPNDGSTANTPAPGAVLAGSVGQARLALAEGDIESAMDHLSQAALIDPDHGTVLGTATQIVNLLVARADSAAESGLWKIADLTLARAGRIATRFGLDPHQINRSARRHAQMDRFILINPGDAEAIRAAAGKRVTVFLKDGSNQEAVIKGVRGSQLLLEEDTTVRGGTMYYVEKVPLDAVDYLKVWED